MFEKLYTDNIRDLTKLANKYFKYDEQVAEDAVQGFFLKLIRNKPVLIDNPNAYIKTAFYNYCASVYQGSFSKTSKYAKTSHYDPLMDYRVDKHTPESICSRRSSIEQAKVAMKKARLSRIEVKILLAVMYHGSYRSAAKELGITINYAKVVMSRYRHLFKDIGYAAPAYPRNKVT